MDSIQWCKESTWSDGFSRDDTKQMARLHWQAIFGKVPVSDVCWTPKPIRLARLRCLFFFCFSDMLLWHGKEVSNRYKQEEKRKRKGRRRWEKWVCDSLTWCLMTEICAPNISFFFPSKPFSNLDPIPLHCSCRYIFFILLLLFSCVFGFFIANALQLCAFSFVSFKCSYVTI